MQITKITDDGQVASIFDDLVVVCFPPDERCSRIELVEAARSGKLSIFAARGDDGWAGVVMLEDHGVPSMRQLSWLAVAPRLRGAGLGGQLLEYAIDEATRLGAKFLIGEVEDPAQQVLDPQYGNPADRARFYRRHGAVALPMPYQQPPLGPGLSAVPLMLMAFSRESFDAVPVAELKQFLWNYVGNHAPTWAMVSPWLVGDEMLVAELSSETFWTGREKINQSSDVR